ncbi:DUF2250 domain-containing protein [Haloferacaceae archaeon DSL9]
MSTDTGRGAALSETDVRVLTHLRDYGANYPALIASNTGLHVPFVERRCHSLGEDGLIEPVSGEVIYRITEAGRARLAGVTER